MSKIKVDLDDLIQRLEEMREDEYVTVELEIVEDDYCSELHLSAISFDSSEPLDYGSMSETDDDIF